MNASFNDDFCTFLEYYLRDVFVKSQQEEIKSFWCDGIAMPSGDQLHPKHVKDKRKILTRAWLGINGQCEYEMTIKFGRYSQRQYAKMKNLKNCIPNKELSDWILIDIDNRTIELQLL